MGKLDGQVAFITGGARGQGRSHAQFLASEGADIVICDLADGLETVDYELSNKSDLEETVRLVEKEGRRCIALEADVRSLDDMTRVVDAGMAEFGRIDICIANAGIMSLSETETMSAQMWDEMISINLTGVFNTVRAALPHMVKAGYGRIVATSSAVGHSGWNNLGHYAAAKWGVIGLIKSVSNEVCHKGITANVITPANVNTPMIRNEPTQSLFLPGIENPTEEQIHEAYAINPMGVPWIEPIDVSRVVLFLVSPENKYMTGETIGPLAGAGANNGAA